MLRGCLSTLQSRWLRAFPLLRSPTVAIYRKSVPRRLEVPGLPLYREYHRPLSETGFHFTMRLRCIGEVERGDVARLQNLIVQRFEKRRCCGVQFLGSPQVLEYVRSGQ